jgi:predicted enzyme related to lactoylglutathione lyase
MATNPNDRRVDYIEFPAVDIAATKDFYTRVFGWKFTDYGPEYTSFEDGRLSGGFWKAVEVVRGGALVVIYAAALEAIEAQVRAAGGTIVKEIFSFPGGRRFHFTDPNGNELAVWSE